MRLFLSPTWLASHGFIYKAHSQARLLGTHNNREAAQDARGTQWKYTWSTRAHRPKIDRPGYHNQHCCSSQCGRPASSDKPSPFPPQDHPPSPHRPIPRSSTPPPLTSPPTPPPPNHPLNTPTSPPLPQSPERGGSPSPRTLRCLQQTQQTQAATPSSRTKRSPPSPAP